MPDVRFTVPGEIVPWARARSRGHIRFTPKRQRDYKAFVGSCAASAMRGRGPLTGPLFLTVVATYPWPESWPVKKRAAPGAVWKTSRPDADNITKIIKDSMNLIVYQDDAQIVRCTTEKRYGDVPMLSVVVSVAG